MGYRYLCYITFANIAHLGFSTKDQFSTVVVRKLYNMLCDILETRLTNRHIVFEDSPLQDF